MNRCRSLHCLILKMKNIVVYKKKMSQVTRSTSGKSEHCSGKGDNHDSQLWVYKYS